MPWYKIEFNKEQFSSGVPGEIFEMMAPILKSHPNIREITVLAHTSFDNEGMCSTYYFSPKAAVLFFPLIKTYDGIGCGQPPKYFQPSSSTNRIAFLAGDYSFFEKLYEPGPDSD